MEQMRNEINELIEQSKQKAKVLTGWRHYHISVVSITVTLL